MFQRIVVYIIILVAAVLSGILLFNRFTKPDECARQEGCSDCPLADNCNKKKDDEEQA